MNEPTVTTETTQTYWIADLYSLIEETFDNFLYQPLYWGRLNLVLKSWSFRMSMSESDLKNKVPKNTLGIYSIYCDKSQWSRGDGVQNFWNALNEGWLDMGRDC